MTAFAFLDYVAVLKEWTERAARHAEVRRVLAIADLADRGSKRVRTLSGGQRRRLGLAQSLIGDPRLLILDEPTTGLDPAQRASLRAVLSARGDVGAVVLATHQTEDVAALCERVIVLADGQVHFDGPVIDFVATAAGSVWLHDSEIPGARVSWRTGTGRIRSIGGTPPDGAEPAEPSVEDAYLLDARTRGARGNGGGGMSSAADRIPGARRRAGGDGLRCSRGSRCAATCCTRSSCSDSRAEHLPLRRHRADPEERSRYVLDGLRDRPCRRSSACSAS